MVFNLVIELKVIVDEKKGNGKWGLEKDNIVMNNDSWSEAKKGKEEIWGF